MGRNESTVELLVKVWEGIREFLEVPNESTGFFFRHMRVTRLYVPTNHILPKQTHHFLECSTSYWNNIESRFDVSHSRSQECISQKISNLNLVFYKVNKLWYLVWLFLCLKCGTSISTVGTLRWTRYLLSLSAKFRSGFSWRLFWVSARSETDKNSRLNTHV